MITNGYNKTCDLALLKSLISFHKQINKISKHDMVICLWIFFNYQNAFSHIVRI